MNDQDIAVDASSTRRVTGLSTGHVSSVTFRKRPRLEIRSPEGEERAQLEFGDVLTGQRSPPQQLRFKNTGNAPLTITSIGPAGEHGFVMDPAALELAVGASQLVAFSFRPVAEGAAAQTLVPASDAATDPAPPLELRARGIRYPRPPRVHDQADAPDASSWKKHPSTEILRWGALIHGLRWYWEDADQGLFFFIEAPPPDAALVALEGLEGRDRKRSLEEWCEQAVFERWQEDAEATREDSAVDLGPLTRAGVPIMRVGFGTNEVEGAHVTAALERGYRLIDTAYAYKRPGSGAKNLAAVGGALAAAPVPQEDLFVIFKVKPEELAADFGGSLEAALEHALGALQRDWVDCLMLHDMPADGLLDLAAQMAGLVGERVRYIGLSNAGQAHLEACAAHNLRFVENKLHPKRQDPSVREYCAAHNISYIGYSILGSGNSMGVCGAVISDEAPYKVLDDGRLRDLAAAQHMTGPAQLALTWAVRSGTLQIPTSRNPGRLHNNFRTRFLQLDEPVLEEIRSMDDVITTAEQEECLLSADPSFRLKALNMKRSHWNAVDALYGYGTLAGFLNELGGHADLNAPTALKTAVERLLEYAVWIQGGIVADLHVPPGNFFLIEGAFERVGAGPAMALAWWAAANNSDLLREGCREARTSALGEVGLAPAVVKPWENLQSGDAFTAHKRDIFKLFDDAFSPVAFEDAAAGDEYTIYLGPDMATSKHMAITVTGRTDTELSFTVD